MDLFELGVRDVQPQPALGVGLHNVTKLPADGIRRYAALQPANPARRNNTLEKAPENAADAHIDFHHAQNIVAVLAPDFKGDIVDAHYFVAVHVDDLLIQQVASDSQHILIVVIRSEHLIAQTNTLERDRLDLIVPDAEPGGSRANQISIHTERIGQRHQTAVADAADATTLHVVARPSQQVGST